MLRVVERLFLHDMYLESQRPLYESWVALGGNDFHAEVPIWTNVEAVYGR